MNYLRRRPMLVALAILLVFLGVGLVVIRDVARESARRSCISSLEERVVLREFFAYARSRNPSPAAEEFFSFFDRRLTIAPTVCEGTGVDIDAELAKVAKARPSLPEPSSTTSTSPPVAGTPGPAGPAGRSGRDAPPTPSSSTSSTTSTSSSSTPPTTSRRPILPTLPIADRDDVAPGPGDGWHAAGISALIAAAIVGLVGAAAGRRYPRG